MRRFEALVMSCLLLSPAAGVAAEPPLKLIQWEGQAEVMDPVSGQWSPARAEMALRPGMKVRTGPESSADFSMDIYYENVLRLHANSRLSLLNDLPLRIALDEGILMVLREENHVADKFLDVPPRIRILTRDFVAEMAHGGAQFETLPEGVRVKVFGDSVKVFPKKNDSYDAHFFTVQEGYKYVRTQSQRMDFQDYDLWQSWYRQNDERKDELAATAH